MNALASVWNAGLPSHRLKSALPRSNAKKPDVNRLYAQITAIEEREAAAIERAEPLIDEVTGVELPKDSFHVPVEETDWGVSVFVDIYDSPV